MNTNTQMVAAPVNGATPPPSLAAWQARAVHTITLPSGMQVRIRIPGVATILEHGDLPDDLAELALAEITRADGAAGHVAEKAGDADSDTLKRLVSDFGRFQRHLVAAALVEPALDYDDVTEAAADGSLPEDDLAYVAEIVLRIRNKDARGVTIGVDPLDRWQSFRETHGCADEGCEGCDELRRRVSTADVVPL